MRYQPKTAKKAGKAAGSDQKAAERGAQGAAAVRGRGKWAAVLDRVRDYYARTDPACWELLRMRYLEGMREEDVIRALYIGRTTYYSKELEALSTVGIYAAAAGLLDAE